MAEFELNNRQAALILEVSEGGEVKVEVAVGHSEDGSNDLATAICQEIATRLVNDEQFQEEILAPLYEEDDQLSNQRDGRCSSVNQIL